MLRLRPEAREFSMLATFNGAAASIMLFEGSFGHDDPHAMNMALHKCWCTAAKINPAPSRHACIIFSRYEGFVDTSCSINACNSCGRYAPEGQTLVAQTGIVRSLSAN